MYIPCLVTSMSVKYFVILFEFSLLVLSIIFGYFYAVEEKQHRNCCIPLMGEPSTREPVTGTLDGTLVSLGQALVFWGFFLLLS